MTHYHPTSAFIAIVLFLCTCSLQKKPAASDTFTVKRTTTSFYRYCKGSLQLNKVKDIRSARKGTIHFLFPFDSIPILDSARTIARIDPDPEDLKQMKRELTHQTKELDLLSKQVHLEESLFEKGQASRNQVERLHIDLLRKEQELAQLTEKTKPYLLDAPFRGQMGQRSITDGADITEGTTICNWYDIASVYVAMKIPDYHLSHIAKGDSVTITGGMTPRPLHGCVRSIQGKTNGSSSNEGYSPEESATATAFVAIDTIDSGSLLVPSGEVLCTCHDTTIKNALVVPVEFLHFDNNNVKVLDSTGVPITITLGVIGDSLAEVTAGLSEHCTLLKSRSNLPGADQ